MPTPALSFPRLPSVWDGPMVLRPLAPGKSEDDASPVLDAPVRQALAALTAALEGSDILRPEPAPAAPVSVTVPPDIAAWFAGRGLDLDSHVEKLLRSYIVEIERRR